MSNLLSETARQGAFLWPALAAFGGLGWLLGLPPALWFNRLAQAGNSDLADTATWISLLLGLLLLVGGLLGLVRNAIRR